jgi:nanoRNase/pAp phosphatase (c-di-AMP/oligoRNAs hydrolase)
MRLLTRSDFDGLICAVLLKEAGIIDEYKFVHPKDIQDGKIEVDKNDCLANIPFVPGCGLWFDHHSSEEERLGMDFEFEGRSELKDSCARVIWEYYGGHDKFPKRFDPMLEGVDKSDSGKLSRDDILHPEGWILLSFIMDPRTGLGRYRDYRISNYQLMEDLIEYCRSMNVDEILQLPDVQERVRRYFEQDKLYRKMLEENTTQYGNLIVIDLRNVAEIYTGNRFMEYVLWPDCNISLRVIWGFRKQNIVFTVGHSVLNRTSKTDVGALMLKYGGGGHPMVGTCQVPIEEAEQALEEIIAKINEDG